MICIRGCTRPCSCEECRAAEQPIHEHEELQADEPSLMCRRCTDRLSGWLSTILDDTLHLSSRIPDDYSYDKESQHHKVTGSPALVRLDVAALTDPRTSAIVKPDARYGEAGQPKTYEENRTEEPAIDIPGEVCSWARIFTEEQGLDSPVGTMAQAVAVLTTWFDTVVQQSWVDDLYAQMQAIRRLLDRAHDVEKPKALGSCFNCDRAIYARPGSTTVRCNGCGRRYDGMEVVRLEVQRRREATG